MFLFVARTLSCIDRSTHTFLFFLFPLGRAPVALNFVNQSWYGQLLKRSVSLARMFDVKVDSNWP